MMKSFENIFVTYLILKRIFSISLINYWPFPGVGGSACGFVCLWARRSQARWPLCLVFKASIFSGTKTTLAANPLDIVVRPHWVWAMGFDGWFGFCSENLSPAFKHTCLGSWILLVPCVCLSESFLSGVSMSHRELCKFGTIRSQSGTAWMDFENTSNMKTCLSVPSALRASGSPQNWAPRSCSAPSDLSWTRCGAWAEFSGT